MLGKVLLAILALARVANAQCTETTTTANSQADLDALSACATLTGDLVLGSGLVTANINGIKTIRGNLLADNDATLLRITAPDITTIGGTLGLTTLTLLSTVDLPALRSVHEIYLQTLPSLTTLGFQVNQVSIVRITDTQLGSLDGIDTATIQELDVYNNGYLKEVKFDRLTNITGALSVEFNNPSVEISFPNVTWINNATFIFCGSVQLPSLGVVNGSLGFEANNFTTFSAPKLTAVGTGVYGGDVRFFNEDSLTDVSMPLLQTIAGTLQFSNDSKVKQITGFPKLSVVLGSIELDSGIFETVEFPALKDVRGGFTLETSAQFDCTEFDALKVSIIKGSYSCKGAAKNTNPTGTTSGPQSSGTQTSGPQTSEPAPGGNTGGGSGGGLSTGAIAGIAVGVGVPLILMGLYLAYRFGTRRRYDEAPVPVQPNNQISSTSASIGFDSGKEPGIETHLDTGGIQFPRK
ncbi:hypothetical protein ABW20_dc0101830 [Dactylellina cionopaga]|nr:hypothetical protein ABW20_dc0101830 [Dactylellina cionopaga]